MKKTENLQISYLKADRYCSNKYQLFICEKESTIYLLFVDGRTAQYESEVNHYVNEILKQRNEDFGSLVFDRVSVSDNGPKETLICGTINHFGNKEKALEMLSSHKVVILHYSNDKSFMSEVNTFEKAFLSC